LAGGLVIVEGRVFTYFRRVDRGNSLRTLEFEVLGTGVASADPSTLEYRLDNEGTLFSSRQHVAAVEHSPDDGYVYVLLCDQSNDQDIFAPCWVGRVLPGSLAEEDAYEFYDGGTSWVKDLAAAAQVLDNGESEMTLHLTEFAGETQWVVVFVPPFTCDVVVRTAENPWGPYSEPEELFSGDADGGSRCYGGKLHPEFSGERVTITWVSSGTLDETLDHEDLYWPHVTRATLD
jgi:Domain of unknown function (DUF4185)